jgi:integrase
MASIVKKGERKYLIRVSKGTGNDRMFLNKTFRGTLADARAEGRRLETLVDSDHSPLEITLTVEKAVEFWLGAVKPKIADRTHNGYQEYLRRYLLATVGRKLLADVKTYHIQTIYIDLSTRLSATTVRNLHRVLTAFFGYMVRKQYLKQDPSKGVDLPAKHRKEMTVLTEAEAARLIEACQTARNGAVFYFALETGMRPEEYLALRWRDIDFQKNTVSVDRAVSFYRQGGGFYFTEPKTAKSRRLIQISGNLRNRLMEHRREQNEQRLASKLSYEALDLVFANEVGRPFAINNLTRRYLAPILTGLDLGKHITLYSLRHSCATLLLMLGENPKVVADRLGHSSVTLTLDTYSHVLPHIQEAATAKLDNVLRMKR